MIRSAWFIRHAESVANAGGITTESSSYGLSPLGKQQIHALAAALQEKPDLIVYSPYERSRLTAQPVMARYPNVPVEVWPIQEVHYLDAQQCIGTTQEQRNTMATKYWEKADPDYKAPGAESFRMFMARVQDALNRLATRSEPLSYLVCHGHFMNAVAWLLATGHAAFDKLAMRHYRHFSSGYPIENCMVMPVYFHPDGTRSLGALRRILPAPPQWP